MKTALASVISASESPLSDWNRMTKTSAVLRKLSLNAAKNWHQNSGANRLDNSRGDGMPPHYCKVPHGLLPEKIRRPFGSLTSLVPPVTQKRAFPSCDSRVIAARAKHVAMPITIINNVIHNARILFHGRNRFAPGKSGQGNARGAFRFQGWASGAKPDRGG